MTKKSMYKLTYEDAELLCKVYKDFNFYKTMHMFGKYKVVTFNYFLCEYSHFNNPLTDRIEVKGHDMRGVTFVFNEDGTLWRRFLMLPKFFNVNQVEETQMNKLCTKKIKRITVKEDGSLVAFMQLPNGQVFAKTQAGFTNDQSVAAMNLYHSQANVKEVVDNILDVFSYTPLFEYVSYDNRIVLKYDKKELRYIGSRDNESGEFYSGAVESYNIPKVKTIPLMHFDELDHMMKNTEDMEGVVVEFEDGQLVKWKTTWYFNLHGIRTVNIFREDFVIEHYLKESLDDVTQELNMTDDADAFKFIERVKTAVNKWSAFIDIKVDELAELWKTYEKWGTFAFENRKAAFFALARTKIETPDRYKEKKIAYMLKMSYRLNEAKSIVDKWQ